MNSSPSRTVHLFAMTSFRRHSLNSPTLIYYWASVSCSFTNHAIIDSIYFLVLPQALLIGYKGATVSNFSLFFFSTVINSCSIFIDLLRQWTRWSKLHINFISYLLILERCSWTSSMICLKLLDQNSAVFGVFSARGAWFKQRSWALKISHTGRKEDSNFSKHTADNEASASRSWSRIYFEQTWSDGRIQGLHFKLRKKEKEKGATEGRRSWGRISRRGRRRRSRRFRMSARFTPGPTLLPGRGVTFPKKRRRVLTVHRRCHRGGTLQTRPDAATILSIATKIVLRVRRFPVRGPFCRLCTWYSSRALLESHAHIMVVVHVSGGK